MTALEAIEILKTDMGCYECTFGCSAPYECANGGCPFRAAIHLAVERLSIDILPKMIKTEQTMSDGLIKRSDAIEVAKAFWYKPDIAGALAELPTIETKQIKYFDEDEKVWKIGAVIIDSEER